MEGRPFDLGKGRQGPTVAGGGVPMLGQGRTAAAPPYRIDLSDEEFTAVGDIVVATLAPPREASRGGVVLPEKASPFHVAIAVGPKVTEICGVEIEPGDVFAMEGAAFADTLAGRVWFVRADKILSVVTRRSSESPETLPAPPDPDEKSAEEVVPCMDCDALGPCRRHCTGGNGCMHQEQCGEPPPEGPSAA